MSGIGRNDPCPCGSGRKYKKCCLAREPVTALAYAPAEREDALARLFRFARRTEFEEAHADARTAFWANWMDDRSDADLSEAMGLEASEAAYQEWFAFDVRLSNGSTIVAELLAREGD